MAGRPHHYTIVADGVIDRRWQVLFPDMEISVTNRHETVLSGIIRDQSALYGMLSRLRDLRLGLILVQLNDYEGRLEF